MQRLQEYNFQSSRDSAGRVRLRHTQSSYSPGTEVTQSHFSVPGRNKDEDKALTGMVRTSAGSRQQMDK